MMMIAFVYEATLTARTLANIEPGVERGGHHTPSVWWMTAPISAAANKPWNSNNVVITNSPRGATAALWSLAGLTLRSYETDFAGEPYATAQLAATLSRVG